jgi:hydroxypyruvate isomerase
MMSRRNILATTTGALAAGIASTKGSAAEAPQALLGRINHSVCRWCYGKIPLPELCVAAKKMGLGSVELLTVEEIPVAREHGLTCAMVFGVPGGIGKGLNRPENHDAIVSWFAQTAPKAAALGCKNIIVFSGNRGGMDDETGIANCAAGIKRLLPICEEHGVVAVMELLNSKVNHKDYMCDRTPWGAKLCQAVGSDKFKLLYDIYHMQIMEGDVISTIREYHQYIGHYHTGGVPGRAEIDATQELNYPAIMRAIVDTGYKGFVGQEFIPKGKDPLAALEQGVRICDV